jgi:hypothetical protein
VKARLKHFLKIAFAIALAGVAVGLVFQRVRALSRSGEDGARIWFYDQSEKRLYAVPNDTIPPHQGIGGKSGDGVRAFAVTFGPQSSDPAKPRIAYLETYSPELKRILEQIHAARVAHKVYTGPLISPESDFYQTNTLVKLPEDQDWSPLASPSGLAVNTKWRSWRGPGGETPLICVP